MTMTTAFLDGRARGDDGGDPAPKPKRRSFDAPYKARILAEYEALATYSAERGSLLRREGLYASHIAEWRNTARRATPAALTPSQRQAKTPTDRDLQRARERIATLEAELARTRLALEITGKAHALLELFSESAACAPNPKP